MNSAKILENAWRVSALVVGDICLDRWCRYDRELAVPSRETGLPRCAVTSTAVSPGAGGTVAANLAALGAGRVSVLGTIGHDGFGHELRQALSQRNIETDFLIETRARQTFTYTKLMNDESGREDLPRVDFVNAEPLPSTLEHEIVRSFSVAVSDFDLVLVADQAETPNGGVVTPGVRKAICAQAKACGKTVFVADSRQRMEFFRSVICTPNEEEAAGACMRAFGEVDYERLHRLLEASALVVTASDRGARLVNGQGSEHFDVPDFGDTVDKCGAGDSLTAGLGLALAVGLDIKAALRFAMIVARITVGKPGTGVATPSEVAAAQKSIAG